jgi:TPR repeat protein
LNPLESNERMTLLGNQYTASRLLAALAASAMMLLWMGAEANAQGNSPVGDMSLEASATSGDPFSAFVAGRRHLISAANSGNLEEREKGLKFIAQSADAGFAPAARFAGALFLQGELMPKDVSQAIAWFTRAAKLGDVAAQLDLGELYSDASLVEQDLVQAALWYETALANPAADYNMNHLYEVAYRLGDMYAVGIGVEQNPAKARALWQSASDKVGYPPALKALAAAQAEGFGGDQDRKAALNTYKDAATAYREAGIRFKIGPETARREVSEILLTVRNMKARGRIVKWVQMEMDRIVAH